MSTLCPPLQIATSITAIASIPYPSYFTAFIRFFTFFNFDIIPWESLVRSPYVHPMSTLCPPYVYPMSTLCPRQGEWKKWDNASFFGAPFIWTTLHDFGGTDGMKGNLQQVTACWRPPTLQPP